MPNLINQDGAGNTFYNYITPVSKGVTGQGNSRNLFSAFFPAAWSGGVYISSAGVNYIRPDAPGLENRTGLITNVNLGTAARIELNLEYPDDAFYTSATTGTQQTANFTGRNLAGWAQGNVTYAVASPYALAYATFADNTLSTLIRFHYIGYLRESVYTGAEFPLGLVSVFASSGFLSATRVNLVAGSTMSALSTAANAITSPPIFCTPGTDPGDGSETFTDIVIRDAAAPNNPVGKLWNCIDMPASCNVGELWRQTGQHDADDSDSEQDVYLCVMPWGTRKLGMRVWTENVT